jgi:general L-amino acid transport system permease protein
MTEHSPTTRLPADLPPITTIGPLGWLRKNLFGSVSNTLLTLVSLTIVFVLLRAIVRFIFLEADFSVVTSNLTLFAIGRYPREHAWRTVLSLGIVIGLVLTSLLIWRNLTLRRVWMVLWGLSVPAIWVILAGIEGSSALPFVGTRVWSGLLLTLMLAFVGIVASLPIGVLLALGRRSDLPIIRALSTIYIELIRGVPLVTLLFLAQVILPLFVGFDIDVVVRAMAALTLFFAAYLAESIRGGLQAIPGGQSEAAMALGLNPVLVTVLIVLPQAIRIAIPTIVGTFISLFKDTTLVSVITLLDLAGITDAALGQSPEFQFHKKEAFLFIGAIYFVVSYGLSWAARRVESGTSRMGGTRQV